MAQMTDLAQVTIHSSQFPDEIRAALLQSLRERQVNHKFHYDSIKQTQKWLALHEVHSPARTDKGTLAVYDEAFCEFAGRIGGTKVHVIGLGCGGGQKDTRLLELLAQNGKECWYSPVDVSTGMVLVARRAASRVIDVSRCFPVVCDLATATDLQRCFDENPSIREIPRLITFFGMLPNFEPEAVLPAIAKLFKPGDAMLFSANLAPGEDYSIGVSRILPQYDNELTRDWLETFLVDLGVERSDGEIRFEIQTVRCCGVELKRVVANFHFKKLVRLRVYNEEFRFEPGESVRLFFSYRHTPKLVKRLLGSVGMETGSSWLSQSGEEGVFEAKGK